MAMEEEFGMEIADEEAEKLRTVQDVISFVTARAA
jgi:acyl carrier protein